jgi:hypothetical protein
LLFPRPVAHNFPPITEWKWTIPGYAISNYIATDAVGVVHTKFPPANSNVVYYWVDGGNKEVTCTVKIMGKELITKATLNVLRPSADWTAVKNAVTVDSIYHAPALHFGWIYSATNKGMLFNFTNPDLKGCGDSWNYQWAQVGSTYARVNYYTNNVGLCSAAVAWIPTSPKTLSSALQAQIPVLRVNGPLDGSRYCVRITLQITSSTSRWKMTQFPSRLRN